MANNLKEKDLKKTAIILLLKHPIWFLVAQHHRFTTSDRNANFQGHSIFTSQTRSKIQNALWQHVKAFPKIFYRYHLHLSFFVLLFSMFFYRYIPNTALVSMLILSSKILVFLTAFEYYHMQYLAMYYGWLPIIAMAFIERKVKKNTQNILGLKKI